MNKIVVITSNIAPYRLKWCEQLAKFYEVELVYSKDHDYERDDRWLKNSSEFCKIKKLKNEYDKYDPLCFDVIDVIKNNPKALIIFDGYGPKTNLLGLLYCRLKNRVNVVNVDGYSVYQESLLKKAVKRFVISHLCSYFFCSGEACKQHLISYHADPDKITIHNFSSVSQSQIIDNPLSNEDKLKKRKELHIACSGKMVLAVGRFLPLKRFEDLINAVKICHSSCDLYILGGKPTDSYLQLTKDSTNIHFIDFVLPEDVKDYYQAADLFVLPSESDVWGLVLNEAMAQGLPVIASEGVIGGKSLIEGNGLIFKTYDVQQLAEDIDYCLNDDRNKKMSLRSLQIIKDFTIETMVQKQLPVIQAYFEGKI